MIEQGTIESQTAENLYEVRLDQTQAGCHACAMKDGCGRQGTVILASGEGDFCPGNSVDVLFSEKNEALRFFWVFLFPLLTGLTGILLSFLWWFPQKSLPGFLFFIAFFAAGLGITHLKDKKGKETLPKIRLRKTS